MGSAHSKIQKAMKKTEQEGLTDKQSDRGGARKRNS